LRPSQTGFAKAFTDRLRGLNDGPELNGKFFSSDGCEREVTDLDFDDDEISINLPPIRVSRLCCFLTRFFLAAAF